MDFGEKSWILSDIFVFLTNLNFLKSINQSICSIRLLNKVFPLFQLELLHDQVKLRHAAKAISFDEFNRGKPDDEPKMFDLRARLLACLDVDNNSDLDHGAYDNSDIPC